MSTVKRNMPSPADADQVSIFAHTFSIILALYAPNNSKLSIALDIFNNLRVFDGDYTIRMRDIRLDDIKTLLATTSSWLREYHWQWAKAKYMAKIEYRRCSYVRRGTKYSAVENVFKNGYRV